ncbi:MAG: M23 family metallopeptidase [Hyphomicrobium sp.]|jgi:murein DD-endopeptidase MepM/ murein hydrolase activator NlpD
MGQGTQCDGKAAIPVEFPLAGEWLASASPGDRIPSHGTDMLGQRYAYDFVHAKDIDLANRFWIGMRYWLGGGIDLKLSSGMNAPILAPIAGKVIAAKDGWPERQRATPLDVLGALTVGLRLTQSKLRADYRIVAGNYLIIEGAEGFAFLAHATTGSICIEEGETVSAGQTVAEVGDTGNSTAPHLHFHLMDGPNLWTANGLPSCFIAYQQRIDDAWQLVENGIPGPTDRLRYPI